MIYEFLVIGVVFVAGVFFVAALGMSGLGVAAFGFLAGSFLLVTVGFLLVVCGLPTNPVWMLASTFILSLAFWFGSPIRVKPTQQEWVYLACALSGLALIVFVTHEFNLVKYHIDSFRYLLGAWLLASDNYDLDNLNLITKRNLAVPILQSLGRLYDDGYVRAISPALSASLLLALWWYHSTGTQPTQSTRPQGTPSQTYRYAVGVAMLLLLVSNNRYVFHSFYVNGHLFFAICYVVITASGWLLATRPNMPRSALLGLAAAAIMALTVTRPEAPLAIMLAIAPLLLSDMVTLRSRALVLGVYGASTIVWSSFVIMAFVKAGAQVPAFAIGPLVLGIATLVAIPVLAWSKLTGHRRQLLLAAEALLWLALAAAAILNPQILVESLAATYENVVGGAGAWGASLVVLAALVLLVLILCRDDTLVYLQFPLTAFIPLFLLLAYFRGGGYRVGDGDSLNRMLIQVVPLAALYIAVAATSHCWRVPEFLARRTGSRIVSKRSQDPARISESSRKARLHSSLTGAQPNGPHDKLRAGSFTEESRGDQS